jgi:TolB protein
VVFGTVQRTGNTFHVEMRLYNVRNRELSLGKQYDGIRVANPRAGAHAIADDIHEQRGLHGVARTRLTWASDRDNERVLDSVEKRDSHNIYVSDYDGANVVRVTSTPGQLNINPNWSPDGRSLAYTTYRPMPQIIVSNLYLGTKEILTDGKSQGFLPVFSPDGTKIAFMSDRDGDGMEIYVMNRDGSGVRRLTRNKVPDSTPTWSPTGTQIAFTSERSGQPQIWVMDTEGLDAHRITFNESLADRATWSPAPWNEIAYAGRSGPGFDIRIYDVATRQTRQLTNGEGSNESPAFAPNGRHLAFTSSRAGKIQIYTIARDGKQLTKLTSAGNNWTPNWK